MEVHGLQEIAAVCHGILNPPLILQDVLNLMVEHGGQMIDLIIGGHNAFRVAFLGAIAERLQLIVIFDLVADVKAVIRAPVFLVVGIEVLQDRGSPDTVSPGTGGKGRAVIIVLVLHAGDVGGSHLAGQVRIFAVSFLVPAPAGIAAQIDSGRKAAVTALADSISEGAGFLSGHVTGFADQLPVKSCGHTDGLGKGSRGRRRIQLSLTGPGLNAVGSLAAAGGGDDPQTVVPDPQGEPAELFLNRHLGNEPFRTGFVRKACIIQRGISVHMLTSFPSTIVLNILNHRVDFKSINKRSF